MVSQETESSELLKKCQLLENSLQQSQAREVQYQNALNMCRIQLRVQHEALQHLQKENIILNQKLINQNQQQTNK